MSHKVSEFSQLGGSLSTQPHSGVPVTQVEVKSSFEDILLPLQQNYGVGQQVTFEAPQTSQYTDLSKSYVRIQGNWQQLVGGGVCTEADLSAPVVNFPAAMFNSVQLFLNNKTVSPNRGGDQYISFVDRLVLGRRGAFQNSTQAGIPVQISGPNVVGSPYDIDQGYSLDQLDTVDHATEYGNITQNQAVGLPRNVGADMRAARVLLETDYNVGGQVANAGSSEYIYQPVLGGWKSDKLLPDLVKIRLLLTIADPEFYTTCDFVNGGRQWAFVISKMELVLHRVEMANEVIRQNTEVMLTKPWLMPTYLMEYSSQAFQLGGQTSYPVSLSNMYSGARPKFVLLAVQDYLQTTNDTDYNPYFISEGTAGNNVAGKVSFFSNLQLLVNGKPYPLRRPYQPISPVCHVRDYRELAEMNIDGFPASSTALINYMQYCLNYTWYVFILDAVSDVDTYSPTEDVVIDVEGTLQAIAGYTLLNGNAICHLISYIPAVMKVDASRNVEITSKSGVPINYL